MRIAQLIVFTFVVVSVSAAIADDWPQWLGPKRDAIWRETGILSKFPEGGPQVPWRIPIGPGYSGPAVHDGRVYITDRQAKLDSDGKQVVKDEKKLGSERLLCLDGSNGKIIWTYEYDCPYSNLGGYASGPRVTPLIDEGLVYSLGATGQLHVVKAENREVVWKKDLPIEYGAKEPVWGYAAHPLIFGDRLICSVGGEGSAIVAFNKKTGEEIWKSLTVKEIGYAPPVLFNNGGTMQVVVWLDTMVAGLDPATGKKLWSAPFPAAKLGPAVTIVTPQVYKNLIFVSDFYSGSVMVRVNEGNQAKVRWQSDAQNDGTHRESLNALMASPKIFDGHIYGMAGNGELRCLDAETGKLVWRDLGPTGKRPVMFATTFMVQQDQQFFLFNDQGFLIIAQLSREGYRELDRAKILDPVSVARGRKCTWSHPAFADRAMFARNDKELVRVNLQNQKQAQNGQGDNQIRAIARPTPNRSPDATRAR